MSTRQITIDVPEQHLLDANPTELGHRLKLYAALLMYQSGSLSAGAASELADVDRFTFAVECARFGIAAVRYAPDELAAELELSRPHAPRRAS